VKCIGISGTSVTLLVAGLLFVPAASRADVPNVISDAAIRAGTVGTSQRASISILTVGTGRCVVIACPTGEKILNDCGTRNARAAFLPSAKAFFDSVVYANDPLYVVLSHSDVDHIGLVKDLVGVHPVRRVLLGGVRGDYASVLGTWLDDEEHGGAVIQTLNANYFDTTPNAGLPCGSNATNGAYVLGSNAGTGNDASIVLGIHDGTFQAVLLADIERAGTAQLINHFPTGLAATLVEGAHHGSDTDGANPPTLGNETRPDVAVFSAGSKFRNYAHPRCMMQSVYFPPVNGVLAGGAAAHTFSCYNGSAGNRRLTPYTNVTVPIYNTNDTGAFVLITDGTAWRAWTCPGNIISSLTCALAMANP